MCLNKFNNGDFFAEHNNNIHIDIHILTIFFPIRFSSPYGGFTPGCDYCAPLSEEKFVTAVTIEVVPRCA